MVERKKLFNFAVQFKNTRLYGIYARVAELVDALDSKSSSSECGFDSHLEYKIKNPSVNEGFFYVQFLTFSFKYLIRSLLYV